jgi:anti-sigma regulatory factor (Ser/Thr protein kinase)/PAS domain-containing protein
MECITWMVVARESAFDQLKLDLQGPHILTRTPRDKIRQVLGTSDVVLVELAQSGPGFDFRQAAQYGLPVPFLLRCDTEGQYIGVCRFGLHKEIFDALNSVGEWWELRAGRSRPYEVFRKLLNRVSDGIAELDSNDRIRWVNTPMKQTLPNLEWTGARLQDVVRDEDRHRLRALRAQHATGVVVPFAVHMSNDKQVELDPSPWFDEQGELVGTSLLFRSVRNTEEQESRANELFCMYSLATSLGQATTVEEALVTALDRTTELLNLPGGGVILDYEQFQISRFNHRDGEFPPVLKDHFKRIIQTFPANKRALVERKVGNDSPLKKFGLEGFAAVPIEIGEHRAGGFWLLADEQGNFARETVSLLISIVNQLSVIVENLAYTQSRLSAELEKKRFYKDALCAVTRGKLSLCERAELESAWGLAGADKGRVEITETAHVPKCRRFVEEALADEGLPEEKIADAAICATEAVGNVVKHADSGSLEVRTTDQTVTIRIDDQGPGIDFAHLPNAVLNAGFSTAPSLGMGYSILLEMMDHVHLTTDHTGTVLLLEILKQEADPLDAFAHLLEGDF